jgi:hypothetical protein
VSTLELDADEILRRAPRQLFPGDEAAVKSAFKRMAHKWHPDHCGGHPRAAEVFDHLRKARDAALGKTTERRLVLTRKRAGDKFALDYVLSGRCDAGTHYVGVSTVSYLIDSSLEDLCLPAINMKWEFHNDKMKGEMTKYLPNRVKWEDTTEGIFLAYRRNPDQILLSHLLEWERQRGRTPDYQHVMWMISSLLNTCCYLEVTKTAHCGIVPEYLLVSPEQHSVALTGPPLYATPRGMRPKAVPQAVLQAFPRMRSPDYKVTDSKVDLTMVRQLALGALGHNNMAVLARDTALPEGLRKWLSSPAPESAIEDYKAWEKARGKRSFHHYEATAAEMHAALGAL